MPAYCHRTTGSGLYYTSEEEEFIYKANSNSNNNNNNNDNNNNNNNNSNNNNNYYYNVSSSEIVQKEEREEEEVHTMDNNNNNNNNNEHFVAMRQEDYIPYDYDSALYGEEEEEDNDTNNNNNNNEQDEYKDEEEKENLAQDNNNNNNNEEESPLPFPSLDLQRQQQRCQADREESRLAWVSRQQGVVRRFREEHTAAVVATLLGEGARRDLHRAQALPLKAFDPTASAATVRLPLQEVEEETAEEREVLERQQWVGGVVRIKEGSAAPSLGVVPPRWSSPSLSLLEKEYESITEQLLLLFSHTTTDAEEVDNEEDSFIKHRLLLRKKEIYLTVIKAQWKTLEKRVRCQLAMHKDAKSTTMLLWALQSLSLFQHHHVEYTNSSNSTKEEDAIRYDNFHLIRDLALTEVEKQKERRAATARQVIASLQASQRLFLPDCESSPSTEVPAPLPEVQEKEVHIVVAEEAVLSSPVDDCLLPSPSAERYEEERNFPSVPNCILPPSHHLQDNNSNTDSEEENSNEEEEEEYPYPFLYNNTNTNTNNNNNDVEAEKDFFDFLITVEEVDSDHQNNSIKEEHAHDQRRSITSPNLSPLYVPPLPTSILSPYSSLTKTLNTPPTSSRRHSNNNNNNNHPQSEGEVCNEHSHHKEDTLLLLRTASTVSNASSSSSSSSSTPITEETSKAIDAAAENCNTIHNNNNNNNFNDSGCDYPSINNYHPPNSMKGGIPGWGSGEEETTSTVISYI